jgi:hypothetical protein
MPLRIFLKTMVLSLIRIRSNAKYHCHRDTCLPCDNSIVAIDPSRNKHPPKAAKWVINKSFMFDSLTS